MYNESDAVFAPISIASVVSAPANRAASLAFLPTEKAESPFPIANSVARFVSETIWFCRASVTSLSDKSVANSPSSPAPLIPCIISNLISAFVFVPAVI